MDAQMGHDELSVFAADLRALREDAGLSVRGLAKATAERGKPYSRTALAQSTDGHRLPTLDLMRAYVDACGGDLVRWESRWRDLHLAAKGLASVGSPASPWPAEPPVDGADPESAGCAADASTAHARKIARTGTRHILGVVELRYSPRTGTAWGRFRGYGSLDHLATHRHEVVVDVGVARDDRADGEHYREIYSFDYHWSSVLRTTGRTLWATATIYFDEALIAEGATDRVRLD